MPLTDIQIRRTRPDAKPRKPRKLFDAGGLYLHVFPAGGRYWRMKYRYAGKAKLLALGVYPEIGLREARAKTVEARALLRDGQDPGAVRAARKARAKQDAANSFEAVAREWAEHFRPKWTPGYYAKVLRRMECNLFPWIGGAAVETITAPALLECARRTEQRGAIETAHRIVQDAGQVFRYAVATGRAERDPSGDLRGALAPVIVTHHAAVTDPRAVGELLRALAGYRGTFTVVAALRLTPLLFVRPGELRAMEWAEIDFEAAEWRIPAARMKMREAHIVPLAQQAIACLRELHPLTGHGRYVFPGARSSERPMSENTINAALRNMGIATQTAHGFRTIATTLLNEQGWHRDAIERQLAHAERDSVRGAYNRAEHLPERRRMMQAWADYLDGLRTGAQVIPLRRGA